MTQLDLRRRQRGQEEQIRQAKSGKKLVGLTAPTGASQMEYLRKAAHEIASTADAIVSVTQRVLVKPCAPEQHNLLKTARSSAGSLLVLAKEMKKVAAKSRSSKARSRR